MDEQNFNILYDVYNELLKDCICHNWFNRPHMLAKTAQRWILDKEINKCLDHPNHDPLDILNEDLFYLELDKLEITNKDAKIVYFYAIKFLREIIYEYERKIRRRK